MFTPSPPQAHLLPGPGAAPPPPAGHSGTAPGITGGRLVEDTGDSLFSGGGGGGGVIGSIGWLGGLLLGGDGSFPDGLQQPRGGGRRRRCGRGSSSIGCAACNLWHRSLTCRFAPAFAVGSPVPAVSLRPPPPDIDAMRARLLLVLRCPGQTLFITRAHPCTHERRDCFAMSVITRALPCMNEEAVLPCPISPHAICVPSN